MLLWIPSREERGMTDPKDKALVEDPYVVIARQLSEDQVTREKRQRRGRLIEKVAKAMYQARCRAHKDEDDMPPEWDELDYGRGPYRTMATAAVNLLVPE